MVDRICKSNSGPDRRPAPFSFDVDRDHVEGPDPRRCLPADGWTRRWRVTLVLAAE